MSIESLSGNAAPFLFSGKPARFLQWQKILSLLPAGLAGAVAHGAASGKVLGLSLCGFLLAEAAGSLFRGRRPSYHDGENIFFGLLLGLCLPLSLPAWAIFAAAFLAGLLGREIFGGFGQALFFPPALGVLLLSVGVPALAQIFDFKQAQSLNGFFLLSQPGNAVPFLAYYPGAVALDDISLAALAAGGIFLVLSGQLRWELPAIYLTVFALLETGLLQRPPADLASGTLILGAFYGLSATAGLPLGRPARRVFAALAALLAVLIPGRDPAFRLLAGILAANAAAPWMDIFFRQGLFLGRRKCRPAFE